MKKTTTDELFANYARTAPLLDLQFYLRRAESKLAAFELPAETVSVIAEMATLEQQLADVAGTPALKKRVWTLIDRYKGSIPGWTGQLGAPDYFVDAVDSDETYWAARAESVIVKTKTGDYTGEGPITKERILSWHAPRAQRSDELHRERVPHRAVPLSDQELAEVIGDAQRQGEPVAGDAPAPKPAARPTPAQRVRLLEQELAEKTRQIADLQKRLQPVTGPTLVRRARVASAPAPVADGRKTCAKCETEQPLNEFAWGAGHTIRNYCKTCRKGQREAAASRQPAA